MKEIVPRICLENNYWQFSVVHYSMGLLIEIFPGIEDWAGGGMPNFSADSSDGKAVWEILGNGENGLVSQISEIRSISEDFGDGIFVHSSAKIGDFVRIEGPAYIGKNAEVRHGALIRKGSWICEEAIVGHCSEIKNSILLPYSKAPHFNYVGDSIVGFGVNLGAGVKLSNFRNDGGLVYSKMGDSRINTGLRKMGALIGDGSKLGCNVVTNPGAIICPNSSIAPNETISGWFDSRS